MKTYKLSSAADRFLGIVFSAVALVVIGLLLLILRGNRLMTILVGVAFLLLCVGLGYYALNLFKAAVIVTPSKKELIVRSFPSERTMDISEAVQLQTMPVENGQNTVRILVFTNEKGEAVASVSTFFTFNHGVYAEPMAIELAKTLGISFKPTLEPWEYDKEKRKEHEKELALQEKQDKKKGFQTLKNKLLCWAGRQEAEPASAEEDTRNAEEYMEQEAETVNYDALDDET